MSAVLRIKLSDVDLATIEPGDPVACTVGGLRHDAHYDGPASFPQCIWVKVAQVREVGNYKLKRDMFSVFYDEFVINDDGTACGVYEEG